jgi:hypothetical protein
MSAWMDDKTSTLAPVLPIHGAGLSNLLVQTLAVDHWDEPQTSWISPHPLQHHVGTTPPLELSLVQVRRRPRHPTALSDQGSELLAILDNPPVKELHPLTDWGRDMASLPRDTPIHTPNPRERKRDLPEKERRRGCALISSPAFHRERPHGSRDRRRFQPRSPFRLRRPRRPAALVSRGSSLRLMSDRLIIVAMHQLV